MTQITASEVNKLRQQTGAGMMDCKKALLETNGDFEKAIDVLRKKGQKVAAKRADRSATEGAVLAMVNDSANKGVILSLNCETDFVAKNDNFLSLAKSFLNIALDVLPPDIDSLKSLAFNDSMSINDKLVEQTGVIGEKLDIPYFERVEADYVGSYTHGVKIAVLVGLNSTNDGVDVLAKDLSMQIASMGATTLSYLDFDQSFLDQETDARIAAIEKDNIELSRLGKTLKNVPKYISMAQLSEEVLSEARKSIEHQLKLEGKPEHIWDKIIPGKIDRFILDNTTLDQEQCLLDQVYIKDESINVRSYIETYGTEVKVKGFKRVSLG